MEPTDVRWDTFYQGGTCDIKLTHLKSGKVVRQGSVTSGRETEARIYLLSLLELEKEDIAED